MQLLHARRFYVQFCIHISLPLLFQFSISHYITHYTYPINQKNMVTIQSILQSPDSISHPSKTPSHTPSYKPTNQSLLHFINFPTSPTVPKTSFFHNHTLKYPLDILISRFYIFLRQKAGIGTMFP